MWGGTQIRNTFDRRSTYETPRGTVDKQNNRFLQLHRHAGLLLHIFRIVVGVKTTMATPLYTKVLYIECHVSSGGVHKTRLKEPENARATCARDGGVPVWIPRVYAVRACMSCIIMAGVGKKERMRKREKEKEIEREWEKVRQQAWQTSLYYYFTIRLMRILFYLLCTHIHYFIWKKRNNCFIVFKLVKANLTDYYYCARSAPNRFSAYNRLPSTFVLFFAAAMTLIVLLRIFSNLFIYLRLSVKTTRY